jgi:hypothetical protein
MEQWWWYWEGKAVKGCGFDSLTRGSGLVLFWALGVGWVVFKVWIGYYFG